MFVIIGGIRLNTDRIAVYHKQMNACNAVVIQFSGFQEDCTIVRLKTGKAADKLMETLDDALMARSI